MPHFKNAAGELFWLDPQDVANWKRTDWEAIDDDQADTLRAEKTAALERAAEQARQAVAPAPAPEPAPAPAAAITGQAGD